MHGQMKKYSEMIRQLGAGMSIPLSTELQEPAQTSDSGSSSSSDTAVAAAIVLAVALAAALVVIVILIRQQRKPNVPLALPNRSVIPDATFTLRDSHSDPPASEAVIYDTAGIGDDSFSMPGQIRSLSSTAAGPMPRNVSNV